MEGADEPEGAEEADGVEGAEGADEPEGAEEADGPEGEAVDILRVFFATDEAQITLMRLLHRRRGDRKTIPSPGKKKDYDNNLKVRWFKEQKPRIV